ncbi:MAG: 1-deoxy-D-xylulose-5-phosphate reductoisomerase [Alloprevotella sp.]|nr:1-deoxy-D-xylulose-5-phosphate reductoisomerase [Alloprevotella sp.]
MNNPTITRRRICLLGSTGSIGTQTLDVIERNPDLFEAHTLTAGSNERLLIEQARKFHPDTVVIADETKLDAVRDALADLPVKVFAGEDALCQVTESDSVDIVVGAMVGFAGLRPAVAALRAGKPLALANKETLVVAGSIITELAAQHRCPLLPIDSEHSAILQCLCGASDNRIEKILLTASGGPFRTMPREALENVTIEAALRHPNWSMGAKITIDSATMMNKGFEMIEARWLFGTAPKAIEVVVHPESIIHSAVQFEDGAVIAQLGLPDMRLPIQYALSFPHRLPTPGTRLDLFTLGTLHFERPDMEKFPCLALAYEAAERGGNVPCAMNAANEVANLAFRKGQIGFTQIPQAIQQAMQYVPFIERPTLDDLFATDESVRLHTREFLHIRQQA